MRLGISLQPAWPIEDGASVLRAARHAEDLGFDHVAVGNRVLDSGFGLDADPFVLLSAVAGATTRVRLLTSVLVAPYYPALLLANQAASLDVLSGGRLILGVGTGWNPDEFAGLGLSAKERGARTDDHLAAAKALWTRRPADFEGRFTTLHGANLGTPPLTPGGPPVWVGGQSEAALRRVQRFGAGWYGSGADAAAVAAVREELPEHLTLASAQFFTPPGVDAVSPLSGRPLGGETPSAASIADDLGQLAEAGLTTCTLWLPIAAADVERTMDWIAAEVVPLLGS
ncbi:TIGR03619 family F420-dependent LLM class oxidoreductase [Labedaea rhizosphaerae]|uniref:Putative F420-dependent oxidoreductase n=1 Tax=Labedaea rhizosphaerae TaxID=598644 RepID=A0A4R6SB32_LABRH|nr:TIGR03619 family F420-dependent LLM class oxidoreductase [Labedaea rhizosphaerae]TDP96186.1 putative F420-dependent oxidoreductase [Labedaea rhizosphaerae]